MSDLRFEEWLSTFRNSIRDSRFGDADDGGGVPLKPSEEAFTQVFVEYLQEVGQVPDLEYAYLKKKIGRANGKLNAYGISEDDGCVDLVVAIHEENPDGDLRNVPPGEILSAVKSALHVFVSAKKPFHLKMEPSTGAYDMIDRLHESYPSAGSIRLIVLVDGVVNEDRIPEVKNPPGLKEFNIIPEVWSLERLYRAISSGLSYESVTIDFEERLGRTLPCISSEKSAKDHHCHLAIIPGELLHDLYHEYGARLLELNVRSFLQARGKVNQGIRDTLKNDPAHFLAYNNGISATVEELDLVENPDGTSSIRSMTGLQIVNGGQTVASIHRAKDRDGADLSGVQVQAKITEVKPKYLDKLVPNISRYSNTQNKVNETDFSANHPFHVSIEQLSEKIWVPGETSRWFYERSRGRWEVERAREGTTPTKKKKFDQKTPKSQRVDKVLLAKAVNTWDQIPYVVSLGGQKNFVHFMTTLEEKGSKWEPDEKYFKDLISRVVIYKCAEKIARRHKFPAFRANAVCYTLALLSYRTAGRVDLDWIWEEQGLSEALEQTIHDWMPEVCEQIVESAEGQNVTEWCKKTDCWSQVQSLGLEFDSRLSRELNEGQPLPNVGKYRKDSKGAEAELTAEEKERQAKTMSVGFEEWRRIVQWGEGSASVKPASVQVATTILTYALFNWKKVPSPKQTKHTCAILEAWKDSGEAGKGEED